MRLPDDLATANIRALGYSVIEIAECHETVAFTLLPQRQVNSSPQSRLNSL